MKPAGRAGAVVPYSVTATDDRPGVTVASSPASSSFFSVAITRLTCTGAQAQIVGTAWTRNGWVGFTVDAHDGGLAGDTLGIHGPDYGAAGPVAAGDLTVRIP